MAAIPDQGAPGEADMQPDIMGAVPTQNDLLNAYSAGYNHADIIAATGTEPPRPDIGEIWGGVHPADATWNDPTKLDTPEQASGLIHQMAESGLGVGSVEGIGLRAASLGVKTLEAAETVAPVSEAAFVAKTAAKATIIGVGGLEIAHDTLGAVGGVVGNQVPIVGATSRRPRGPENTGKDMSQRTIPTAKRAE